MGSRGWHKRSQDAGDAQSERHRSSSRFARRRGKVDRLAAAPHGERPEQAEGVGGARKLNTFGGEK
jgi:hypothetical protein